MSKTNDTANGMRILSDAELSQVIGGVDIHPDKMDAVPMVAIPKIDSMNPVK